MAKSISIFRRISIFRSYKKTLLRIGNELENKFNLRIDDANRMYTVLNIPEEIVGDAYSLRKSDIDKIADNFIRQYCAELGKFLNANGLSELYDFYELKKVDKYSYLIIVGFSLFRTDKRRERLMKYWLPIGVGVALMTSLLLVFL